MKVLFLDFDGVINTFRNSNEDGEIFSAVCCKNLNKLLSEVPDLKIVVSSSWRHGGLEYVKKVLKKNNIDNSRVIDITGVEHGNRGNQIKCWLDRHKDVKQFVILDDDADMEPVKDRLIKTSSYIGLTTDQVEKAIKMLK